MPFLSGYTSILFLSLLVAAAPSFAADVNDQMGEAQSDEETAPPPPPPARAPSKPAKKKNTSRRKKTGRRVADVEPQDRPYDEVRATGDYQQRRKDVEFRGGVDAGYTGMNGTQAGSGVAAIPNYNHNTLGLGADADVRGWKYFGFEAEGFLGISSSNTDLSSSTLTSRSLSGFAFDIKGQFPIQAGQVKFVPKLGIGYAFAQLSESNSAITTVVDSSTVTRMTGFYAIGGAEVEPYENWLLSVDYLHNFSSDGSSSNTALAAPTESVVSGDFDRLRAGVFYRIVPHFVVGGEYVRRTYNYGFTNQIVPTNVLGLVPVTDARVIYVNEALALFLFEL